MKIERHWWNGITSPRGRRDVYILTDGERWDELWRLAQEAPNGRYLYDIHDGNNQPLKWLIPLSIDQNFGGLDVPKPPPGG